jgi:hypothetical protein
VSRVRILVPIWNFVWKSSVVVGAFVLGAMAANQAGWSNTELVVESEYGQLFTDLLCTVSLAIAYGSVVIVQRIAKPALWLIVPILLYSAAIGGWNGYASDFDHVRGEAIRHHYANAYAMEHMNERGLFLSCQDKRIALTEDAKAVCASRLNVGLGERIPGSEHKCGPLGMLECYETGSENTKPNTSDGVSH